MMQPLLLESLSIRSRVCFRFYIHTNILANYVSDFPTFKDILQRVKLVNPCSTEGYSLEVYKELSCSDRIVFC